MVETGGTQLSKMRLQRKTPLLLTVLEDPVV